MKRKTYHEARARNIASNILAILYFFIAVFSPKTASAQTPVALGPQPLACFRNSVSDLPLSGGLIYAYQAGTNTLQATFADSTGTIQNTNPVILDSSGCHEIWFSGLAYKIVVKDSGGVEQYETDNFQIGIFANGNNNFTGNNTFSGTTTFNGLMIANSGGTLNGTFSGNPNFSGSPTFSGTVIASVFQSTVSTGTAPLIIASTTLVPNLNVDNINGVAYPVGGATGSVATVTAPNVVSYTPAATVVAIGGYKVENVNTTITTVTNTPTETTLYTYTVPANEIIVHQILRVHSAGEFTQLSGDGLQVSIRLYIDGNVVAGGNSQTTETYTGKGWIADGSFICLATGGGGTIRTSGSVLMGADDTAFTPESGPYVDGTEPFDTTTTHVIKITATWSGTSGNESMQGSQWFVERLN